MYLFAPKPPLPSRQPQTASRGPCATKGRSLLVIRFKHTSVQTPPLFLLPASPRHPKARSKSVSVTASLGRLWNRSQPCVEQDFGVPNVRSLGIARPLAVRPRDGTPCRVRAVGPPWGSSGAVMRSSPSLRKHCSGCVFPLSQLSFSIPEPCESGASPPAHRCAPRCVGCTEPLSIRALTLP